MLQRVINRCHFQRIFYDCYDINSGNLIRSAVIPLIIDNRVFEHSRLCWNYLIDTFAIKGGAIIDYGRDVFSKVALRCTLTLSALVEPIKLPGLDEWCSKQEVKKILASKYTHMSSLLLLV